MEDKPFVVGAQIPTISADADKSNKYILDREQRRAAEVDQLYEEFVKIQTTPIILTWAQFEPYAILYNRAFMTSINMNDPNVRDTLSQLSSQLLQLINPQREFHVYIEEEGTEPFYLTFPPIWNVVKPMTTDESPAVAILHNYMLTCDDQPWKIHGACQNFMHALANSQDPTQLTGMAQKSRLIADKFKAAYTQALTATDNDTQSTDNSNNETTSDSGADQYTADIIFDD